MWMYCIILCMGGRGHKYHYFGTRDNKQSPALGYIIKLSVNIEAWRWFFVCQVHLATD